MIAVPTDTIYGISCLVQHQSAVDRLYSIKGRNASKPIAICVAEIEDIYRWANVTVSRELIEDLLPGQVECDCYKECLDNCIVGDPGVHTI